MNNCVAVNIFSNGSVLNKEGIPILFYWDGKSDVFEQMTSDNKFMDLLYEKCFNIDNYTSSTIAYFYFTEDEDGTEHYNDNSLVVQHCCPLALLDVKLTHSYIFSVSTDLYRKAFTSDFKRTSNSLPKSIKSIYSSILTKYETKLTRQTYIEYIRVELTKVNPKLTDENLAFIINELNNVLDNE